MSAPTVDPILATAAEHQRAAAELLERGAAELRAALAVVRRHPDYARTERARRARPDAPSREALTLAWWVANGIHSVLNETPVDEAGTWLAEDPERTLRAFVETEERDRAAFQARRRPPRGPKWKLRRLSVQIRRAFDTAERELDRAVITAAT